MNSQQDDRELDATTTDDATYLKRLGYVPELRRALGLFSSFAVQFSLIAVSGSIFVLYGFGLSTAGPAFIWAFVIGGGLQLFVGFAVAELISAYPLAGGAYQIVRRVLGKRIGWQVGWWLLIGHIAGVAFNAVALAPFFAAWLGITNPTSDQILLLAFGLIVFVTFINVFGVRLAALFNNVGVICELLGMSTIIVLLLVHGLLRPIPFLFSAGSVSVTGSYFVPFIMALLIPAVMISSFDSTGHIAEEVNNAARQAPRGVVIANVAAYLYAAIALCVVTLSIGDLNGAIHSELPLLYVLSHRLGNAVTQAYEVVAIVSLVVTTQILELMAARILWAQARDRTLIASGWLSKLGKQKTPILATIVVAIIALALSIYAPVLNVLAALTGLAWATSYTVTIIAGIYAARRKSLPAHPWSYGRWSAIIRWLAALWSAMLIAVLIYQDPLHVGGGFLVVVIVGVVISLLTRVVGASRTRKRTSRQGIADSKYP